MGRLVQICSDYILGPLPASPRGGEGKTIEDAMKGEEISKKL